MGKGYTWSLCFISYDCVWIYNCLIKVSIKNVFGYLWGILFTVPTVLILDCFVFLLLRLGSLERNPVTDMRMQMYFIESILLTRCCSRSLGNSSEVKRQKSWPLWTLPGCECKCVCAQERCLSMAEGGDQQVLSPKFNCEYEQNGQK